MSKLQQARNARAELIKLIADAFEKSGIKYTSGAIVMNFAQWYVTSMTREEKADFMEFSDHNLFTIDRVRKAACEEMHRRYEANKK